MSQGLVNAYLHERANLKSAGLWERVRQVDAKLAELGIAVEDDAETTVDPSRHRGITAVEDETAAVSPPENAAKPRGRPRKG